MTRFLPVVLLIGLYWPGLTNWFYQDDFGWLRLRQDVHSAGDLAPAMFAPKAHGNIRPLGENAYWLGISALFGPKALPFRLAAFATQIASLLLLGAIAQRLTGSRWAALFAPVLWIVNVGLAEAMAWSSIYNQLLSGFFFFLAFYCLLRGWDLAHWAAFVAGLGALETNVAYPAVAAAYAMLFAPPLLKKIAPMFAVSAVYVWAHFHFAAAPVGVYAMHFDAAMVRTFWTYWSWALGRGPLAVTIAITAAVLACAVWRLGLFGLAWFAIALAVYLPLRDHIMDYYLTVPAIGIALVGAAAVARAPRWAAAGIALYLAVSVPAAWHTTRWNHERSLRVKKMVLGAAEARRGRVLLLDGVDSDLFWSGIADLPFLALEIPHVYLAPGSEARIDAPADLVRKFELPEGMAVMTHAVLWNVSTGAEVAPPASWKSEAPRFVNLGDSIYDGFLSGDWGRGLNGYRTLNGSGTVRMGGAQSAGQHLYIGVFRGVGLHTDVPAEVVSRNGELTVYRSEAPVSEWMTVRMAGNGLVFGYLEIK